MMRRAIQICSKSLSRALQSQKPFYRSYTIHTKRHDTYSESMKNFLKLYSFIQAAANGDLNKVKQLVDEEKVEIDRGDADYRTALHVAATEGHLEVVKYLIENGASVNCVDRWNSTPLQDAVYANHKEIIEYLLSKGGKTYLSDEKLALLMCHAAANKDIDLLGAVIIITGNVDLADYDGRTALHIAASLGSKEVCEYLLSQGANINVVDYTETTPVQDALQRKHYELAQWLVEKGAILPSESTDIKLSEASVVLEKILQHLCEQGDFDYGEVWVPYKVNKLKLSRAFYNTPHVARRIGKIRNSSVKFKYDIGEGLPGRVWKTGEAEFVPYLTSDDIFNANIIRMNSALGIPLIDDDNVLGVIVLYGSNPNIETIDENFFALANRLFFAGTDVTKITKTSIQFRHKYRDKMDKVSEILLEQKIFDETLVVYEIFRYFYDIGLPDQYFEHLSAEDIANHIRGLMAAKKVSQSSTGGEEDVYLVTETEYSAYYMAKREVSVLITLEQKIVEYLNSTPEGYGYAVDTFTTKYPFTDGGSSQLVIYTVQRYEMPKDDIEIVDDKVRLTEKSFYYKMDEEQMKRYQLVLQEAHERYLTPVLMKFKRNENGEFPVMLGYHEAVNDSYLARISELIDSIPGAECLEKYITTFSTGLVVYSLFLKVEQEANVDDLLNKASLLTLIPQTEIYQLFMERKLQSRELVYLHSATKFCYYFGHSQTEDYLMLLERFKNDKANLSRLLRLETRAKRDALNMNRIYDAIFRNVDLCKELYQNFKEIALGHRAPSTDLNLHKKIKNTVVDPLDSVILHSFLDFNAHILKTNFFKFTKAGLSYRLNPSFLGVGYPEIPYGVFMVIGSEFIGFHVGFKDISRGGVRVIRAVDWQTYIRNVEELFQQNYDLAWVQQLKNKDIPEGGAKGTILLDWPKTNTKMAFQKFTDSILDLILKSKGVYDHFKKEEVLFFGPADNTSELMDWAALLAKSRGYAYWKAFTSGKSVKLGGIPHDVYGMTTTSIHEYILKLLEKFNLKETEITKVQTGGPDGDLGANEIKVSKDKTLAIVDVSGVLYDPEGIDRTELMRLVELRKPIKYFDESKLSPGGFKVLTTDKNVTLPDGSYNEIAIISKLGHLIDNGVNFRNQFHLNKLFAADLVVPCGGRPHSVDISNVHKFIHKPSHVPKIRFIVEGANLFFTQEARLELEKAGIIVFKDISTNKGSATSSSLEVFAALSFTNEEFEENMQIHHGKIPEFYKTYVSQVLEIIKKNARLEFDCLWREREKTKFPFSILSEKISEKIMKLKEDILKSEFATRRDLVARVMQEALPPVMIEKIGLEKIMERLPPPYLTAIFASHIAKEYVYRYGFDASEFEFYQYMSKFL